MYQPKFTITSEILQNIGVIEAAKEIINTAPLIPAWRKKFQAEAKVRSIHYGTHLEGNELSFTQAKRVIEGEKIAAKGRDIQEVINYRNVLKFLEKLEDKEEKAFEYSPDLLKKIHQLVVKRILEPDQAGNYRERSVVIKAGQSGQVVFSPPPAVEVPYRIEDFFNWLNSKKGRKIHPVLRAGIAHFELVKIHPFLDGNGRVSRAMTTLVLFVEGYDIKRLFSLEEHFDRDAQRYYQALQSVTVEGGDLTTWLEYFSHCLAVELEQVKEKVKKLSLDERFKDKLGRQIALSERQVKLVEYLKKHRSLKMKEAKKILAKVSEDTILRDLKDLMKKKIVKKKGRTKGARYLLAG